MAKMGVPITTKSQWGKRTTFIYPMMLGKAIALISRLRMKKARKSPIIFHSLIRYMMKIISR